MLQPVLRDTKGAFRIKIGLGENYTTNIIRRCCNLVAKRVQGFRV